MFDDYGKYDQSEQLYQRAPAIPKKALGLEHRHSVSSLNSLRDYFEAGTCAIKSNGF